VELYSPSAYSIDSQIIPRRTKLIPSFFRMVISASVNEKNGSKVSVSGIYGGSFTTTFTPWKIVYLPSSRRTKDFVESKE